MARVFSVRSGRFSSGWRLAIRPSVPSMVARHVLRRVWDWRREAGALLAVVWLVGWLDAQEGAAHGRMVLLVAAGVVFGVPRSRRAVLAWFAGGRWRRRWARACRACGLTVSWERTPRVRSVRPTPAGMALGIQVRPGQALVDVDRAGPALAAALGVRSVSLSADPLHAGRGTLLLRMHDPLSATVAPNPLPAVPDDGALDRAIGAAALSTRPPLRVNRRLAPVAAGVPADLRTVEVGRREDGRAWSLPLAGSHVLIAGATGAGKGSVLWGIVRALAPAIRAGLVELWVCDPKGGMELAAGAPLFARFAYTLPAIADLLDDAAEWMTRRADRLRGIARSHTPTPGDPMVVVVVDELAVLTAYAPPDLRKRVASSLPLLLAEGRAPGFVVVGAVQDPRKETVAWRDLFPVRVALRMAEAGQVDLVLGRGAWEAGAHAETIRLDAQGTGYVRTDDEPVPVLVRAAWQDDDDIRDVADQYGRPTARPVADGAARPAPVVPWVPDVDPEVWRSGPARLDQRPDSASDEEPPTIPLRGWWPLPPPTALPPGGSPRIDESDTAGWEQWAADWRRRNGRPRDGRA
jgi:S-DNA-T family DNA segregation ATPase FtsK/SpoIIIE